MAQYTSYLVEVFDQKAGSTDTRHVLSGRRDLIAAFKRMVETKDADCARIFFTLDSREAAQFLQLYVVGGVNEADKAARKKRVADLYTLYSEVSPALTYTSDTAAVKEIIKALKAPALG